LFDFLHHVILKWIGYVVNPGALCVGRKESGMRKIERVYVGGKLTVPHGNELFQLFNPSEEEIIGQVRLADEQDARAAIAAAKAAQVSLSRTSKAERIDMLRQLHGEIEHRQKAIMLASMLEYGAPAKRAETAARHAAQSLADAVKVLESYDFERKAGTADVIMKPIGVAGLITPWNSNAGFICSKVAYALAAGCASIVKPSEMSAFQTDVVIDAFLAAGLPPGVVNILTGRGETVGAVLAAHPDVAKISFTGSTAVGKQILRVGAETCKRVTLELGGKSPTIILDDANLEKTIPMAIAAGFINSGQACLAGTRILVPRSIQPAAEELIRRTVEATRVGPPDDPDAVIGPMVSEKQWERVQRYIRSGVAAGARLLTGGEGRPKDLPRGWFVRPTVFTDVRNDMQIAQEEIFGPVLSILPYDGEEEAISVANDTTYGLQGYVFSADMKRGLRVAAQIDAGRVQVNTLTHEPLAPFGGVKQSGIGRENGVYGLEAFLEPKAILTAI
jgi:aldehyde dehydrogenase (NAD+)